MNVATQERPNGGVKAPAAPRQRANEGSPVRWPINAKYGLGRDDAQFIVYRTVRLEAAIGRQGS